MMLPGLRKPRVATLALTLGACVAGCRGNGESAATAGPVPSAASAPGRGGGRSPSAPLPTSAAVTPNQRVDSLGEEILAIELASQPVMATWLGVHSADDRLDDVRLDAQAQRAARLRTLAERLRAIPEAELDAAHRIDRQLLDNQIASEVNDLLELRPLERSPVWYAELVASGLDELIAHDADPLVDQVRPLSSRLWKIRPFLDEARRNLRNTTADLSHRRALETLAATQSFIVEVLPKLIVPAADPKTLEDFRAASSDAARALEDFAGWLSRDLGPRARGELSLGRERYLHKLQLTTGVESPPEQLIFLADAELREARRRSDELARQMVSAKQQPSEALRIVEDDHTRPEELVPAAQAMLLEIVERLRSRGVLELRPNDVPRLVEMPPERWGLVQPRLSGLLETRPEPPLIHVDPVDPRWPEKRRADHVRALNRSALQLALVEVLARVYLHERSRVAPTTPLKLAQSPSFVEGWPLFVARLYVNALPPEDVKVRWLEARQTALHAARLLAALRFHALGQRIDDIARLFADELGLDEYAARREAERVALDPMSGIETLGRIELELCEKDLHAALPQATVAQVLGRMTAHGTPPVMMLRRILSLDR